MNDRKTEGLFDWSDHSTVTFTSWEFGKPAVSSEIKDCVLMRGEVCSIIECIRCTYYFNLHSLATLLGSLAATQCIYREPLKFKQSIRMENKNDDECFQLCLL